MKGLEIKTLFFLYLFLSLLLLQGNPVSARDLSSTEARQVREGYERLLMYGGKPSEVWGWPCEDGFIQFQLFSGDIVRDTIVVIKARANQIEQLGGISLEEYTWFDNPQLIEYKNVPFFAVTLRNHGNANGNKVKFIHIDTERSTISPVHITRADSLYATTLAAGLSIWDSETIFYRDNFITSEFNIWKSTDTHAHPTNGKVTVLYDMVKTGHGTYQLLPTINNPTLCE